MLISAGLRLRARPRRSRADGGRLNAFADPLAPARAKKKYSPRGIARQFVHWRPVLAVTVTRDQARDARGALSGEMADCVAGAVEAMSFADDSAVPLFTRTVNDTAEAASPMKAGIAGIYTDELLFCAIRDPLRRT